LARELEAWDDEGVVLGILEVGRDFCRTCGGQPLSQLVKTNLRKFPTPCNRKKKTNHRGITLLYQPSATVRKFFLKKNQFFMEVGVVKVGKKMWEECRRSEKWCNAENAVAGDGGWWLAVAVSGGGERLDVP
jgi:hypothetical protein